MGMKKHKLAGGDQGDALAMLRDDNDFICRVLSFLPVEMKQGYGGDDSDMSDGDDTPKTREERQAELREKLHAKLQTLRAKSGSLKAQKNIRKRLNKMEKRKQNQKQSGKGGAINSKVNAVKTAKKQKMIERRSKGALPSEDMIPKPVFNTEGKVVFSKFDFASSGETEKTKRTKKVSLKAKLAQAREKEHQKQSQSPAEASNEAWQAAMRKAKGEKMKDDPKLLAKSLRREQQKKKQSKNKWEERIRNEKQKGEERQNKRQSNINNRKEQKKKKFIDKLKKKGRILPGF